MINLDGISPARRKQLYGNKPIKAINQHSESVEQSTLFRWADWLSKQYPELNMLYHIPNGGYRCKTTAKKLKAEGTKAGVPDICLPVARAGYHGLYIELKTLTGKVSVKQSNWITNLNNSGYMAVVCYGCDEAINVISNYLGVVKHGN